MPPVCLIRETLSNGVLPAAATAASTNMIAAASPPLLLLGCLFPQPHMRVGLRSMNCARICMTVRVLSRVRTQVMM